MDNYADALPCLVCGKELVNVFDHTNNQPEGATSFGSHGQYGSTVFDPMDGHFLEINICDDCLTKAKRQGRVYIGKDYELVMQGNVVVGSNTLSKIERPPLRLWSDVDDED